VEPADCIWLRQDEKEEGKIIPTRATTLLRRTFSKAPPSAVPRKKTHGSTTGGEKGTGLYLVRGSRETLVGKKGHLNGVARPRRAVFFVRNSIREVKAKV